MRAEAPSDADLARRCRQGDARAWRELVRRFTPRVFRLAQRVLRSPAEAEDASQEVFMRVHRSIDGFDATRPLAPWISRITYNACLRRLERRAADASRAVDPQDLQLRHDRRAPDPERAAQSGETRELIETLMDDLSAQDRALMVLRYREGLADAEVAEATGMPVNTVKTRIFRARARLRTGLAPHLGRKPAGAR